MTMTVHHCCHVLLQPCEVEFEIRQHGQLKPELHTVRASLTQDGSRVHQLDGRIRTSLQLKVRAHSQIRQAYSMGCAQQSL